MTICLVPAHGYDRCMAALPSPARSMTLAQINADYPRVLAKLEQGGAILVHADDREAFLGVLTRDPEILGDAQVAQLIEASHVPPLDELLAIDDHSELP